MDDKTRLYALIAQAETIQDHAEQLQDTAVKALASMDERAQTHLDAAASEAAAATNALKKQAAVAINGMSSKVWLCALACVVCGLVVIALGIFVIKLTTKGDIEAATAARQELENLRHEVKILEERANNFSQKAGKAILSTCGKKGRLCIRVDAKAEQFGNKDGEFYYIIYGY